MLSLYEDFSSSASSTTFIQKYPKPLIISYKYTNWSEVYARLHCIIEKKNA